MAVLIEAVSVVLKRDVINEKYPGGWNAFKEEVPNQTLCAVSEIARVGFMSPVDVETYIKSLEKIGFIYLNEGKAVDIVVVDQQRGLAAPCDWAYFGTGNLDGDSSKRVAGCQATAGTDDPLITPEGWRYEGSLSQTFAFAPAEHMDKSLKFIRHEDGIDVYYNLLTGKEVYLGRTSEK